MVALRSVDDVILGILKRIHPGFAALSVVRRALLKIPGITPATPEQVKKLRKVKKRGGSHH